MKFLPYSKGIHAAARIQDRTDNDFKEKKWFLFSHLFDTVMKLFLRIFWWRSKLENKDVAPNIHSTMKSKTYLSWSYHCILKKEKKIIWATGYSIFDLDNSRKKKRGKSHHHWPPIDGSVFFIILISFFLFLIAGTSFRCNSVSGCWPIEKNIGLFLSPFL